MLKWSRFSCSWYPRGDSDIIAQSELAEVSNHGPTVLDPTYSGQKDER
jgi:hypothetical protein